LSFLSLVSFLADDSLRGDESLDLGGFNSILALSSLESSSNDGFLHKDGIVFLLEAEQFLDVIGSLRTKLSG